MEKLRAFMNGLSPADQEAFATRCGTTTGYLRKAISIGQRQLGATLCVLLERESQRAVTRQDLRPDDWVAVWPELEVTAA